MIKDGIKTTELKVAVGGIVSVIIMFMVVVGAISQSEADTFTPLLALAITTMITSAPIVIGWIVTAYTNARRDVKTAGMTQATDANRND